MWNHPIQNWTHDLGAYNRMREAQARAAGRPVSPDTTAQSGLSSPGSDPKSSGLLGQLVDLQVSRRHTEAPPARLAPRSGALPTQGGGSDAMRAQNVHVWHAHTPNSQWVTELEADLECATTPSSQWVTELEADLESASPPDSQWVAELEADLEQVTAEDEHSAPQDRPSASAPRRGLFSQIGGAIQRATGSGAAIPYPEDKALIKRFNEGAVAGESDRGTVKAYKGLLTRFSAWLKRQHMDAMNGRLNSHQLTLDVEQFVRDSRKQSNAAAAAALEHLRSVMNSQDGTVRIANRETAQYTVSEEDQWFIDEAFPVDNEDRTTATYRTALHAFSGWLHANGLGGLCDSFNADELMLNAEICAAETGHGDRLMVALRHLQVVDLGETATIQRKGNNRAIPEVDKQLIADFQRALVEAGRVGKPDVRGRTLSDKHATDLRSFSAWLQNTRREPLGSRLHDPVLDVELAIWTDGKSGSRIAHMASVLRLARKMLPNVPQPEPSFVTPTSEDFAQFDWTLLQTPGVTSHQEPAALDDTSYSSMFLPPGAGWGGAQTPQGGWNPHAMQASHGHEIPWQDDGVHSSAMGDRFAVHGPDLSHVVGSGWRHGPQRASDVLIGVLENHGLLPSAYVPETTFYIHNERYTAQLGTRLREPTVNNPRGVDVRLLHRLQGG